MKKDFTFSVLTLGCKVNQVEGAHLEEGLERMGGRRVPPSEAPRLVVVNTCAVTGKAAYEGRKILRRVLSGSPELVVVTGCYAQVFPEEVLSAAEGPVAVLGHAEKFRLTEILEQYGPGALRREILVSPPEKLRTAHPAPISRFPGHARAFLRVQDGCSQGCAYCIVPLSRGPSRSVPEEEILKQARVFAEAGYREIVITGIHLGFWGRDLTPPRDLVHLLRRLEGVGSFRIRLSSLEVTEITPELLNWAAASPRFAPHFHLPLQSGDDEVLRAMGRPYTAGFYREVLAELFRLFPRAAFGADVLVGFPGESEEAFRRTYRLIEESPLTYLHVFPYSPRPGTRAYTLPRVPPEEVARRARALRELAVRKKKVFYQAQVGRVLRVLVEEKDPETGLLRGLSENYVPVYLEGRESLRGEILPVRVVRVIDSRVYGERL